jgi:rod shape-determining protein MreB
MLKRFEQNYGIDLGTCNTLIFQQGKGIVLQEPSVVAIGTDTRKIEAYGDEAYAMIGRTPENLEVVFPLKDGVISNIDVTTAMLKHFIRKISGRGNWFSKPKVFIAVPCGITNVQKRAVEEMIIHKGASKSVTIEEPLAAAMGAGLPVDEPIGSMVVDIGGGTSQVALISLGGIVVSQHVPRGGRSIDQSIIEHVRKKYNLIIGERTAEEIKKNVATAIIPVKELQMEITGRDLVKGLPKTITITSNEIYEIMDEFFIMMIGTIRQAMEKCPPELAGDIMDRGILLCGGGSLLKGFDQRLQNETGIPVHLAEHPMECIALGTGKMLKYQASKGTMEKATTLYEKIGGEVAIGKVVDYFYELVLADDSVNQFFLNSDMEKQRNHQSKFIGFALGGPNQYSGLSMVKTHEGMNLQPAHFDAIARHLHDALAHFNVNELDINQVINHVATLKDDILYK